MAVLSYKCLNCGGPLKWDAVKQLYSCEYCRAQYSQAELDAIAPATQQADTVPEAEAVKTKETADPSGYVKAYSCPSCGAQIVTESTTAASTCYYCHNPIVLSDKLAGGFHPDCIIPFAIDKKKATEIFKGWVSRHKYIPSDFYSDSQIKLLSCVYFPYWIYNAKVSGRARGKGMKDRVWQSAGLQYTETTTYEINNDGVMPVENISRIALGKASKVLCESVAPFGQEKMRPFEYGYLSGYMAEIRDIEKDTVAPEIRKEVNEFAEAQLKMQAQAGYNRVEIDDLRADIEEEGFKYALMPVWTLTYRGPDGKMYYFSINGDSGKTVGELPVNKNKLIGLFFKVFIPSFAGLLLLFHFLG